jgi:tRNA (mo5U34)-methyltransferase
MASQSFAYVRDWKDEYEESGWWHSFDLPDGRQIKGVCSVEGLRNRIEQFPIPADLTGKRVLDIGAWDGWYSFEMERRGGEVMAVDCWDNPRFHEVRTALKSHVEYRQMDVYDLTPDTVGRFDIVLFMGVLYHLKHPLLALERICAITTDMAAVDSFILREQHRPGENVEERPVMEFYETDEFGGQTDNWCGLSLPCMMAMCRTAGFARVEHRATLEHGASIACSRHWEPQFEEAVIPAPQLIDACHHTNFGINFQTRSDDYVAAAFRTDAAKPAIADVKPEVGGFGVRPISVSSRGERLYVAKFKLPPGLPAGWHDVTITLSGSAPSNPIPVAVDVPVTRSPVHIAGVRDAIAWEQNVLNLNQGNILALWVTGLPRNTDRANLRATLNGKKLVVLFVGPDCGIAIRQVNVQIPSVVPPGVAGLRIHTGPNESEPVSVDVRDVDLRP